MKMGTTFSAPKSAAPVRHTSASGNTIKNGMPKLLGISMKHLLLALVIAMFMTVCIGCNHGVGEVTLPRELQGAWVTDDPQYSEKLVQFWPHDFVVLTGVESQASVRTVYKMERQQYGNGFSLTIYSETATGTRDQIGISYSPANGGELRFRNQKQVWKRAPQS